MAALFHDLGHLVADVPGVTDRPLHAPDDVHEARGARILAPIFGPSVAQPVALHVTAKRWRCTREPSYYEQLSLTSRDSLRAQGGLLSDEQCARFESHPGFDDAVALRAWDDSAKDPSGATDSLCDYQSLVDAVADAR